MCTFVEQREYRQKYFLYLGFVASLGSWSTIMNSYYSLLHASYILFCILCTVGRPPREHLQCSYDRNLQQTPAALIIPSRRITGSRHAMTLANTHKMQSLFRGSMHILHSIFQSAEPKSKCQTPMLIPAPPIYSYSSSSCPRIKL